jgi:hypothetical protein
MAIERRLTDAEIGLSRRGSAFARYCLALFSWQ